MKNSKNIIMISLIAILGIVLLLIFVPTRIDNRTWILSTAQQADTPHFVVAHNAEYDFSNDKSGLFESSKPIELVCEAKNGKLILTDQTNGETYEGSYKVHRLTGLRGLMGRSYSIIINGVEGRANISSYRTLFVSIGGYYLNFEID